MLVVLGGATALLPLPMAACARAGNCILDFSCSALFGWPGPTGFCNVMCNSLSVQRPLTVKHSWQYVMTVRCLYGRRDDSRHGLLRLILAAVRHIDDVQRLVQRPAALQALQTAALSSNGGQLQGRHVRLGCAHGESNTAPCAPACA